jgi:hypothetical protein
VDNKLTRKEQRAIKAFKAQVYDIDRFNFRNIYAGTWKNRAAYAEHYLLEVDRVPQKLLQFIDIGAYINTIEIESIRILDDGDVIHVFER